MTDTPRCDLIDPSRTLELAQTLERELVAMEYRCDMAEGEVMCLDAAVERLRKVLVAVTKRAVAAEKVAECASEFSYAEDFNPNHTQYYGRLNDANVALDRAVLEWREAKEKA